MLIREGKGHKTREEEQPRNKRAGLGQDPGSTSRHIYIYIYIYIHNNIFKLFIELNPQQMEDPQQNEDSSFQIKGTREAPLEDHLRPV